MFEEDVEAGSDSFVVFFFELLVSPIKVEVPAEEAQHFFGVFNEFVSEVCLLFVGEESVHILNVLSVHVVVQPVLDTCFKSRIVDHNNLLSSLENFIKECHILHFRFFTIP